MDRSTLRRAQRAVRRSRFPVQLVIGLVLAGSILVAVPSSAWLTIPLCIAAATALVLVAWPLGPEDETSRSPRAPGPPQ